MIIRLWGIPLGILIGTAALLILYGGGLWTATPAWGLVHGLWIVAAVAVVVVANRPTAKTKNIGKDINALTELVEASIDMHQYLSKNNMNYVGSGSILHNRIKKALDRLREESP